MNKSNSKSKMTLETIRKIAYAFNQDITTEYVSKKLNISRRSLLNKENGTTRFYVDEMKILKNIYSKYGNITEDDVEQAILRAYKH